MGVETDYIASDGTNIDQIWESMNPSGDFNGVYGKGSDPISISQLYGCISGEDVDFGMIDEFETIRVSDDSERSLLKVPQKVRDALSEIDESNVANHIGSWTMTEGFMLTGWDEGIASEFLLTLSNYIRSNPNKDLLMWICV